MNKVDLLNEKMNMYVRFALETILINVVNGKHIIYLNCASKSDSMQLFFGMTASCCCALFSKSA